MLLSLESRLDFLPVRSRRWRAQLAWFPSGRPPGLQARRWVSNADLGHPSRITDYDTLAAPLGIDRLYLYDHQPKENSGGYTTRDLLAAGAAIGLKTPDVDTATD